MTAPRPSLFIDASAWVAVEYPKERNHDTARAFLEGLRETQRFGYVHTSLHALLEAHGWLLHHASAAHASRLLDRVQRGVGLHGTDREILWAAAARLATRKAAAVELADAMNAVVMDRLGIRSIWSYDREYERMGYERVG
ncbi:MAG TPA: hypothetical protein VGR28_14045 [Candidatus Thermoplasmatota archaeon]|jgi:predicted nucleic acid-binding protein|nr:hypothetical protein [Candidatus Thermoplasmatota archaeon]